MWLSGQLYTLAPLCLGKQSQLPVGYEAGLAPTTTAIFREQNKSVAPLGNRTTIPQFSST